MVIIPYTYTTVYMYRTHYGSVHGKIYTCHHNYIDVPIHVFCGYFQPRAAIVVMLYLDNVYQGLSEIHEVNECISDKARQ